MKGIVCEIDAKTATEFLLPRHYSGRKPTITKAYGWFNSKNIDLDNLKAVCTFGKPASPFVCEGICGKKYADSVYELNRLCRVDDWNEPLSQFVSACLRRLRTENWIIVSYSDTAMNHHGYIYQACNFIYTGCSEPRTDMYVSGGKHARHYSADEQGEYRTYRYGKHRYIYFCTFNKRLKREWKENLAYPEQPYPKGDNNEDYRLGDFMSATLYRVADGELVSASQVERTQDQFCIEGFA